VLLLTPRAETADSSPHRALLNTYCVSCHNQRLKTGGVMFDSLDLSQLAGHEDVWEKAVRKLRSGMMPPPGSRRPGAAAVDAFARWLENALDQTAASNPNPGRVGVHRLNRAEYANAIRDLLGIRIDAGVLLPKDAESEGFDNIASALKVSPSFLDQYIAAARLVSLRAVGSPAPKPDSTAYRPPRGTDQSRRVEGLPPGTRGGFAVEHLFPADGSYKINIAGLAGAFYGRGMEYRHTVVLTIDGLKVFEQNVGGEDDMAIIDQKQAPGVASINARFQNIAVNVKAGPRTVGVTFVARDFAESDDLLQSFRPGAGEDRIARIASLEIVGPFNPAGIDDTPSRRRIFVCRPSPAASPADETACARKIVAALARRAYRRPVVERDLTAPLAFYRSGRESGSFDTGIQEAMTAILANPKFLYRAEEVPSGVAPGTAYRLSDLELASRLSFFLWSSIPDDELLETAISGKLHAPDVLERQVRRLLSDARSKTLTTEFATEWLKLKNIDDIDPDGVVFPNFDPSLREAFRREIELFVDSILRDDRSVVDLLTANHTFVNERLALHYGILDVRGDAFRRVVLSDENRWGLLGKGGVLMGTSYANRTAPVVRGAWILENILGTPPASPPPDVEGFQENKAGEKAKTVREIMQLHRAKPSCNACHGVMDPIGFALENFDAIGAWRTRDRDAGTSIDAAGVLIDGTPVGGPRDLRNAVAKPPERFVQTVTEKLLMYALGRRVEGFDMPAVRGIVRDAARDNYRFSSIVLGIVRSAPFQMRTAAPAPPALTAAKDN